MESIKIYFNSKLEADNTMTLLNQTHGLPVEGGISCFGEWSYEKDGNKYYIMHDPEWTNILL